MMNTEKQEYCEENDHVKHWMYAMGEKAWTSARTAS